MLLNNIVIFLSPFLPFVHFRSKAAGHSYKFKVSDKKKDIKILDSLLSFSIVMVMNDKENNDSGGGDDNDEW